MSSVDDGMRTLSTGIVRRVVILGSGSWATASAGLVARNVDRVTIVARRPEVAEAINVAHRNPTHLSGCTLPKNVDATLDLRVCAHADALVVATPSAYLRPVLSAAAPHLHPTVPVCLLAKGVDAHGTTLARAAAETLSGAGAGTRRSAVINTPSCGSHANFAAHTAIAVLSGPNHAEEIAEGLVSAAVIASEDHDCARLFQSLFTSVDFRAYTSGDVVGVSLCGATKNVIAIAAGIALGLGAGDNALAVLMTRGLAEMGRIVTACGGMALTCMGLAGMGDLVATCTSVHSRNRAFGMALAEGTTVDEFERRSGMVVEGAAAVGGIVRLARDLNIEMPIASAVNAILYEGACISDAVSNLLMRTPSEEFYSFGLRVGREDAQ